MNQENWVKTMLKKKLIEKITSLPELSGIGRREWSSFLKVYYSRVCSVLPKKLPPKAKMSSYIIEKSNQYVTVYNQLTHDGHSNHNKHWVVHFWTCSPWESQEEIKILSNCSRFTLVWYFFRVTLAIIYNDYSQSNVLFSLLNSDR